GEGNAGENGTPPGDLYVVLNVAPHRLFERQESDIHYRTSVGVVDAMLGTELKVPTLYGDVKLTIPQGTQPGAVFKVKGKGLPRYGGWGKGDEYVTVEVEVPRSLSGAQKEMLRKFRESS
ncbi:MAG TPA: J domain-containing protein, partial [Nitrososphaerales archaeon]|nr:J domain-containing protein [Nitrososphaerales archaeon]